MKKVLIVALQFPPNLGAAVQRVLGLTQYLVEYGWNPIVLTASALAYERKDESRSLPEYLKENVYRAFAFDSKKYLSIKGKYFDFLDDPDPYILWKYFAILKGYKIIQQHRPQLIWSTFPISSAHQIALKLSAKYRIPWVADFRDPLSASVIKNKKKAAQIDYETLHKADHITCVTSSILDLYLQRYPNLSSEKFSVIANGIGKIPDKILVKKSKNKQFKLLYSGSLYHEGRSPEKLFQALAYLINNKKINSKKFILVFRGSEYNKNIENMLKKYDIKDIVEFLPALPYQDSVIEMLSSNALLLLQGKAFDNQIPSKSYDYLASNIPILGLVSKGGETEKFIKTFPGVVIASDQDVQQITIAITKILSISEAVNRDISELTFRYRSKELVKVFNDVIPFKN